MPTERRLINKKAYEELVLLQTFCERQVQLDNSLAFNVTISIDEKGKEYFKVEVLHPNKLTIVETLKGKNYTEITKELMAYLNE